MIDPFKAKTLLALLFAAIGFGPVRADIAQVQHVVIIFQENRSPDNLFHSLIGVLPGADIATSGVNSKGQVITLTQAPLAVTYDLGHAHPSFLSQYDHGRLDGADLTPCTAKKGTTCPPNPAFEYVDPSEVAPYTAIALNYGFANRMFQSNQGSSFPAHQYIIAGTSQTTAGSGLFAAGNPNNGRFNDGGCIAPAVTRVKLVGPNGLRSSVYPCFEHQTLTDVLDNPPMGARPGLTWRYYTPTEQSIWTAPNAIHHLCKPSPTSHTCTGIHFTNGDIVLRPAQVLTDIQRNTLASVSWVIPSGPESDHPNLTDGSGPSWVASVVNAIGQSRYWTNTVILIAWDDWGGWYDHVAPPIDPMYGYYENGFRVPLLVVSAYTPAGYVSQRTHTFGSMLKFIETAFNLPLVPPGDFADSRADDLSDFFNFSQSPRTFVPIEAPRGADFFLHDSRPLSDPDTD